MTMQKMNDKVSALKNDISESAQMISCQLNGIESSLLGAFASIIVAVFVSNTLGILKYWVPGSFILLWVLIVYSVVTNIFSGKKLINPETSDEAQTVMNSKLPSLRVNIFVLTTKFKNVIPFIYSIGLVHFISLLSLFAYRFGIITTEIISSTTVPIITSLVFVLLPFITHWEISVFDKSNLTISLKKMSWLTLLFIVIGSLTGLLLAVATFILPVWSLVILYPSYMLTTKVLVSLALVIGLQGITALIFINYFSLNSVKKEMTITLFKLSHIRNRIHDLEPYQPISDETYKGLVKSYDDAKRYEMSADDSLFVTFYSLAPNQTFLANLLNEDDK